MSLLPFERTCEVLRASFDVPADALERGESILELQHAALAADPPARALPDAVSLAAFTRLCAGDAVIPRERWPVEPPRVARLLRVMGGMLAAGSGVEESAGTFIDAALAPAQSDDARGVLRCAERLGLPPEASAALLRESMKPEMLRTSLPFAPLVGEAPRGRRCPLCGDRPGSATAAGRACCRWCGTAWTWDRSCPSCPKGEMRIREIGRIVRGASLLQCNACADAVPVFAVPDDPLLLSMLAVLTSPFDLAVRIEADAQPAGGFSVF